MQHAADVLVVEHCLTVLAEFAALLLVGIDFGQFLLNLGGDVLRTLPHLDVKPFNGSFLLASASYETIAEDVVVGG